MRFFVAVNRVEEIGPRQTTALLIAVMVRSGHEVYLLNINGLSATNSGSCIRMIAHSVQVAAVADSAAVVARFAAANPDLSPNAVTTDDLILIRTNPGRDKRRMAAHSGLLELCRVAQAAGIKVVNDPRSLEFFASKASLVSIHPDCCPESLVSNNPSEIVEFVKSAPDDCVLKPTIGSRGENVVSLNGNTPDLESTVSRMTRFGGVIVQHFVHQTHPGDKRVILIGGDVLQVNGQYAGIERRAADGDFRANLHAGGSAHQLQLSAEELDSSRYAATLLNDNGIWLAGVDLIGSKIIEFNVFSTGGLFDAERFCNCDFSSEIVRRLLHVSKP